MIVRNTINFVSYLAPNIFPLYAALGEYLSRALDVSVSVTQADHDPMDDPGLAQNEIDALMVCGLPLSRRERATPGKLMPLAAPVMTTPRYQAHPHQPVYFSDMIVRHDSPVRRFVHLAGTRLCFNDLGSNSGYNVLRYYMLTQGLPRPFFSKVFASGSHQRSIQWVLTGEADCASIDSVVLECELRLHPELRGKLRAVETFGPYPMPPFAAATHLGTVRLAALRSALRDAHHDTTLAPSLQAYGVSHFAPVSIMDYVPLRAMCKTAFLSGWKTIT
jgi:phosphonate transport system substrate-binding protein